MVHHIDSTVGGEAAFDAAVRQQSLRLVRTDMIGRIEPGREAEHLISDLHSDSVLSFNALIDMLHTPVIDEKGKVILGTIGQIEIHSENDELFLLTHGHDDQGNTTNAVLMRSGDHERAVVSIDAGDKGQYGEQHRFRYTRGKLIESYSVPLGETDYTAVFDRIVDIVVSGEAKIVVEP